MKVPVQSLATTLSPTDYQQTPTESEALITSAGITTSAGDLTQVKKAVSNYVASGAFYSCSNVGDAYTLTPVSPFEGITAYKDGQLFRFRPSATNTTQSPTINVNSQGVKNITKADGSTQVDIGDIDSTQDIDLRYDLANDVFVLPKLGVTSLYPTLAIGGLNTENDSGDTAHDIKFNIGSCRDKADTQDIVLGSPLIKQIDANWVAGTGNGGFPSGLTLTANTTYHMFVIAKPDGTVDAGFDTSLTATNLLSDATGYTKYRRVASMDTDVSSNWVQYYQIKDLFLLKTKSLDVNTTTMTTGSRTLYTLSTPLGISVFALLRTVFNPSAIATLIFTSPDETDEAPSSTVSPLSTFYDDSTQTSFFENWVKTNTSSQVGARSSVGTVVQFGVVTIGWRDFFVN